MLWKHRDSPDWDCRYEYVQGEKYAYTALISKDGKKTYCGINEKGFAILNTVSENLKADTTITVKGIAITRMANALAVCATVDEFEELLRKTNGKRRYVTNFAAGDPSGALAFFEVGSHSYKRYDVSDREEGFDVRSNFSFTGDMINPGPSVPRYDIVMRHMKGKKGHNPYEFIEYARNFENGAGVNVWRLRVHLSAMTSLCHATSRWPIWWQFAIRTTLVCSWLLVTLQLRWLCRYM